MKRQFPYYIGLIAIVSIMYFPNNSEKSSEKGVSKSFGFGKKEEENNLEARATAIEERFLYEYNRQVNPLTGEIPLDQKLLEFDRAKQAKSRVVNSAKVASIKTEFINRGPSNLGGRTRAFVIDKSVNTGNTILAGGVSGGVFRTIDGGASWTKVSPNDENHNVTTIAQDPTNTNVWYYGTGESIGNSAGLIYNNAPNPYFGQGIWKSTDGGVTWTQMLNTSSNQTSYDSDFDIIFKLAVHPLTGDLYAATAGKLKRFDGTTWTDEISNGSISSGLSTDVVITSGGRVYASFSGNNDANTEGVWTSSTGVGGWSRINTSYFTPFGRVVLALAPSNQSKLFVLYYNGNTGDCATATQEADLWMWTQDSETTGTFTEFSDVLPLETCDTPSPPETSSDPDNNPFSVQQGYDLVISVKPDDEDFVVIGGTNAYKKSNITDSGSRFTRIGGYKDNTSYAIYYTPAGDLHHPDIHALVFDPFHSNVLYSGTDGGVHKTNNITSGVINWTNLNNNYQTYQYYHIGIDPMAGSDIVIGGAQDNGITVGGTGWNMPDLTTLDFYASGDGCSVAISRDDVCLPFFISLQEGTFYRTFNCGGTFSSYDPITPYIDTETPYDSQFVTLFHLDQDNNKAMYYAAKSTLLRTTDATNVTSSTWEDLGDTSSAFGHLDKFQTFATSWGPYSNSSYLLMGGDRGHIYRLVDPQNVARVLGDATDITPSGATLANPSIVTGLAIHPTNPDIVLATYSNYGTASIFLTTNATAANPIWTLVEHNLEPYSIRSAAIAQNSNGETVYFVGTARGLYSNTDPINNNWVLEAPDEIGLALVSDLKYRPDDHKLLIGTHGNGMYEATINYTLGIDDFKNISSSIKLYPNPVHDNLNVKLLQADGAKISYSVVNLSGQKIFSGSIDKENVDVSQLANGMYFLQVTTSDGRKGTKSFIKK